MAKAPLLKTASMRPPLRASASAAASATEASSARSRGKLSRPSARSRSQSSAARQVAKTRQPRPARVRAESRPIPDEQPVMRIVRAIDCLLPGDPGCRKRGCGEGAGSGATKCAARGGWETPGPVRLGRATGSAAPWIIHLDLKRDSLYLRRTLVWYFRWLRGVVMAEYGVGGGLCTSKCKANDQARVICPLEGDASFRKPGLHSDLLHSLRGLRGLRISCTAPVQESPGSGCECRVTI